MDSTKSVSIEKVVKISIAVMMMIITILTVFGVASYFYFTHGLPSIDTLKNYKPSTITNIFSGEIVQGGSTITQQVVKSLLLSPEKRFARKIREAILAYKIEKNLTKEEILFLYLNQIYLGHGAYGVAVAGGG